ncbi:MAG: metallopeptidase family protein [Candidatus Taylorbacteria bacterium]|nr:metallopeptidase family protein [Candidatus Taylorbacteria bacterium]
MCTVTLEEFEMFVREGVEAIPEKFRSRITNVAFLTDEEPTAKQRAENGLVPEETLFGLYEGIPRPARGEGYGGLVLPDRITIFKRPIEEDSCTREEIRKHVIDTVWHEVAHHFGLDEEAVEKRERERQGN